MGAAHLNIGLRLVRHFHNELGFALDHVLENGLVHPFIPGQSLRERAELSTLTRHQGCQSWKQRGILCLQQSADPTHRYAGGRCRGLEVVRGCNPFELSASSYLRDRAGTTCPYHRRLLRVREEVPPSEYAGNEID